LPDFVNMLTSHSRVLIADNDAELRRQLYSRLLELDVYSDCVADGKVALQFLRDRSYAMVILDLTIAKVEALKIIEGIGELPPERRPMILATTGSDGRPSLDSELVQIVLRKPFSLEDVSAIIRSCIVSVREAREPRGGGAIVSDRREARP
jgi:DNA-binding response OmpR family regulator